MKSCIHLNEGWCVDCSNKKPACRRPRCGMSTSIDDMTLTFGLGKLDDFGFWEEPCHACAREYERKNPGKKAWPRPSCSDAELQRRRTQILLAEKVMGWKYFVSGDYEKWKALYDKGEFAVYLDNEERLGVAKAVDIHGDDFDDDLRSVEWEPMTVPSDALEVLERLRKLGFFVVISTPLPGRDLWEVRGWKPETNDVRFIAHGPSMQAAICHAALDAIAESQKAY